MPNKRVAELPPGAHPVTSEVVGPDRRVIQGWQCGERYFITHRRQDALTLVDIEECEETPLWAP